MRQRQRGRGEGGKERGGERAIIQSQISVQKRKITKLQAKRKSRILPNFVLVFLLDHAINNLSNKLGQSVCVISSHLLPADTILQSDPLNKE